MNRTKKDLPDKVGIKFRISYNRDVMAGYWLEGDRDVKNIIRSWAKIFEYLEHLVENNYCYYFSGPEKCLQSERGNPDIWVVAEIDFLDNMGPLIGACFNGEKMTGLWVRFKETQLIGRITIKQTTICPEDFGALEIEVRRMMEKQKEKAELESMGVTQFVAG